MDRVTFFGLASVECGTLADESLHISVREAGSTDLRYIAIDSSDEGIVVHTDIGGEPRRMLTSDTVSAAADLRDIVDREGSDTPGAEAAARHVVDLVVRRLNR